MKINQGLKETLKKFLLKKMDEELETVEIVAAYELSSSEKEDILKKFIDLEEKNIKYKVDPDIIAGLIIKHRTKVLDLSLLNVLESFKNISNEAS